MEPTGPISPTPLSGHKFEPVKPPFDPEKWNKMAHAALVAALGQKILQMLRKQAQVLKQDQD